MFPRGLSAVFPSSLSSTRQNLITLEAVRVPAAARTG